MQGVGAALEVHVTCLINSLCHVWGTRTWKTNDTSRNVWYVNSHFHIFFGVYKNNLISSFFGQNLLSSLSREGQTANVSKNALLLSLFLFEGGYLCFHLGKVGTTITMRSSRRRDKGLNGGKQTFLGTLFGLLRLLVQHMM